jgi:hypothetical protein
MIMDPLPSSMATAKVAFRERQCEEAVGKADASGSSADQLLNHKSHCLKPRGNKPVQGSMVKK